ncbi:hypothetical protein [Ketogulonicigenium vulgare]|uniref:hypothetical protein n=1 Tax=Ketogulonicigenium vulgare TaxID=92945 RepID=UPI000705B335|nr:hypothetical protein [Ketogulonicigenium vulgare]ALJ81971.1 hypothetical protein KVH_12830 [Ketogulonicigenium vulgare]
MIPITYLLYAVQARGMRAIGAQAQELQSESGADPLPLQIAPHSKRPKAEPAQILPRDPPRP